MLGAENDVPCGIAYLKVLLMKAEVDTRATAAHIRENLTMLDSYMVEVEKQDVMIFNEYVKDQISTLTSRNETSSDIIVNLFKGYKACTDHDFADYIRDIRNRYEEGEDLNYQSIMQKAEMKFQSRMLRKEWNTPTEDQTELIALRAQVVDLAKKREIPRAPRGVK